MIIPKDVEMFDIYDFNDFYRTIKNRVPDRSEYFYIKLAESLATIKYMQVNDIIDIQY